MNWNKIRQPIVVSAEEAFREDYIFFKQTTQLKEYCEFLQIQDKGINVCNRIPEECLHRDERQNNRVISVIGERGSGKTSFIQTASNILQDEGYYTIGPIDPSVFSNSINITELVLSKLYQAFCESNEDGLRYSQDSLFAQELYQKLKQTLALLNKIRRDNNDYLSETIAAEVLDDYAKITNFQMVISKLFTKFLDYINSSQTTKYISSKKQYKDIAIIIDDLDLVNNSRVYSLLEEIKKYLGPSALVILAYRESQLHEAITNALIIENKNLLEQKVISMSEITNQAVKYLEKLTPHSTKIHLFHEVSLHKLPMIKILSAVIENNDVIKSYSGEENGNHISLQKWLYSAIKAKIRLNIHPLDKKELTQYQLPNNLRGILELVKLIDDGCRELLPEQDMEERRNIVLDNVLKYRQYLQDYTRHVLPLMYNQILHEWEMAPTETKNYNLYFNLYQQFSKELEEQKNEYLDIYKVQPLNVALADVYILLEDLKMLPDKDSMLRYFVHAIKVFYSLELIKLYLTGQSKDKDDVDEYLSLLNCYIIPSYVSESLTNQYDQYCFELKFDRDKLKENDTYKSLLSKILYTDISNKGDVKKGARPFVKGDTDRHKQTPTQIQRLYRYRQYFTVNDVEISDENTNDFAQSNGNPLHYFDGTGYPIDLFGFLGKRSYVQKGSVGNIEDKCPHYVILSLFDIDVFVHANYTRRSEKNPPKYFVEQINRLLAGEIKSLTYTLLLPALHTEAEPWNGKYAWAYSEKEAELLGEIMLSIEKSNLNQLTVLKYIANNMTSQDIEGDSDYRIIDSVQLATTSLQFGAKSVKPNKNAQESLMKYFESIDDIKSKSSLIDIVKLCASTMDKENSLAKDLVNLFAELEPSNKQYSKKKKATLKTILQKHLSSLEKQNPSQKE